MGVFIYCLRQGAYLAGVLGEKEQQAWIEGLLADAVKRAVEVFWDRERGFFVSGEEKQISWMSQC